jgi:hypothetical protein
MQKKQYYTAGTGTKSKTNNTTLPEQVQHPKQIVLFVLDVVPVPAV